MKSFFGGFIITLDIYSEIPMPKVERNKKNMKYAVCFIPIVGLMVGALLYGWSYVCTAYGFGQVCFALAGVVIPVIITGGIHLNGLMHTADALNSHEKKERKQEILKSPHVGAFAATAAMCFFLFYIAGLTLIWKEDQLLLLGLSYMISRTLSGMSIVWFPAAEKEGTLYTLASAAHRNTVRVMLVMFLALEFIVAVMIQPLIGTVMALAAMWVWTYYYYMSKNRFGGITGSLEGYFLCLCELSSVLVIGFMGRVM